MQNQSVFEARSIVQVAPESVVRPRSCQPTNPGGRGTYGVDGDRCEHAGVLVYPSRAAIGRVQFLATNRPAVIHVGERNVDEVKGMQGGSLESPGRSAVG